MGAPAKSGRIAFGALIIKERLGITDEEVVEQVIESPYLQYFLGLHEYRESALFDPSMMLHFRSRFGQQDFDLINTEIIAQDTGRLDKAPDQSDQKSPAQEDSAQNNHPGEDSSNKNSEDDAKADLQVSKTPPNEGKLLMDATFTPADITDLKLLNEAREKTEAYLDVLHAPFIGQRKKPRTYRRKARRQFLKVAKQKKPGVKKIRKAIGRQLRLIKRNLGHIAQHLEGESGALLRLTPYQRKCLQVIHFLYEQQLSMFGARVHSVPDRIVSISQPHVRPIVRGKTAKKVEFGAKISISHVHGGYVCLQRLSWDPYNEGGDLISQIENYREHFGFYPESVHADAIYRNRANRNYCKDRSIRLSGPALGRPPKVTEENAAKLKAEKKCHR